MKAHVDCVVGHTSFPLPEDRVIYSTEVDNVGSNQAITPVILRQRYNVTESLIPSAKNKYVLYNFYNILTFYNIFFFHFLPSLFNLLIVLFSSLAVAEFQAQYYSPKDLQKVRNYIYLYIYINCIYICI